MTDFLLVKNSGSAIGEAIGAAMEKALRELLSDIADSHGIHYLTSGVRKTKAGKVVKKLLMSDNFGNEYDIDGVLANAAMQPLILIESKYIRYKKHNRDKGSWICTAHSAVRRRYHSIRSSIAILAGNWSESSLAMLRSNDINLFVVPFELISKLLTEVGIDFNWGEKENEKAQDAWHKYNGLSEDQKAYIGAQMVASIRERLVSLIINILDDTVPREVERIVVELVSNLGEVKVFAFDSVEDALEFLNTDDLEKLFLITDSVTLFDPPPDFSDDDS